MLTASCKPSAEPAPGAAAVRAASPLARARACRGAWRRRRWPSGQWPGPYAPYGRWFWLWLAGLVAFAASFPPALRPYPFPRRRCCCGCSASWRWRWRCACRGSPTFRRTSASTSCCRRWRRCTSPAVAAANVFSSVGWFTMPNLSFAFPALVMKVIGVSFYAQRLSSVLMGHRRYRRDLPAGAPSVRRCDGADQQLPDGRGVLAHPQQPHRLSVRAVLVLLRRWCCTCWSARGRTSSRAVLAAAGIALGFALQGYFPVRILLVIAPLFLVHGLGGAAHAAADGGR